MKRLSIVTIILLIIAMTAFYVIKRSEIAQAKPGNALEVFKSRAEWEKLPTDFLNLLANKLSSVEKATEFAQLCEETGILKNNIVVLTDLQRDDPEFAVGMVAATLTSYANTMGDLRQFGQAKRALELALLLKPRHYPAWASMALVDINMGDCGTAVSWADKVLAFKPDPNSKDYFERGAAISLTPEGEKMAAEALGEPEMIGSTKQLRKQMKVIKDVCRE